jgi:uncharacterized protein (TIGR02444 family)
VIDLVLLRDSAFWKFSVAVYSAPGVTDECLAVQERYGLDVNVLLFCAWIGQSRKIELGPKDIEALNAAVASWHDAAVRPLRSVRRYMKDMAEAEIAALRTRIKAAELDAERIEQAMLFAYAEQRWTVDGNAPLPSVVRSNLEGFLRAHGYRGQSDTDWPLTGLCAAVLASSSKS